MKKYREHEIKILDIDVKDLEGKLEALGAKKVFDGERILTTYDTPERKYTFEKKIIRITEEDKVKLSVNLPGVESIKLFTSKKEETEDFLAQLGINPIARVSARRISYEWDKVDFDIDIFPEVPPFLEIDTEHLLIHLENLLTSLGIEKNKRVTCGTEEVFSEYGKNYYTLFKLV